MQKSLTTSTPRQALRPNGTLRPGGIGHVETLSAKVSHHSLVLHIPYRWGRAMYAQPASIFQPQSESSPDLPKFRKAAATVLFSLRIHFRPRPPLRRDLSCPSRTHRSWRAQPAGQGKEVRPRMAPITFTLAACLKPVEHT